MPQIMNYSTINNHLIGIPWRYISILVNPFYVTISFYTPWKHQKTIGFWCFRVYRKRPEASNGLTKQCVFVMFYMCIEWIVTKKLSQCQRVCCSKQVRYFQVLKNFSSVPSRSEETFKLFLTHCKATWQDFATSLFQ